MKKKKKYTEQDYRAVFVVRAFGTLSGHKSEPPLNRSGLEAVRGWLEVGGVNP